ncbi:MAG: hypothetical protein ABIO70_33880 [Pseudomonadota bacterium]
MSFLRAPSLRALALGAGLGFAVPLVGQLVRPFHIPTHELTQVFALLAADFAYAFGAWEAGRLRRERLPPTEVLETASRRVLLALAALGPAAWACLLLVDSLRCGCRMQAGAAFFWITWPPLALLAGVAGVALGARGWGWKRLALALLGVGALVLAHDGLQALVGFRVVDLLIGKPLGFDQRAAMDPIPMVHIAQRLLVLGAAGAAWCWARWLAATEEARRDPRCEGAARRQAFPALASTALLLVLVVFQGGRFGVGWGRGALEQHLSQELATAHFVLRCAPGGRAALELPAIAHEAEWSLHRYEQDWGIHPEEPLTIYVFDDRDDITTWTDTAATHVVFRTIYAPWWVDVGSTLYHELAHALHVELRPAPTVLLSRGILEGLAVSWEDDYARLPAAHAALAGALQAGTLPHARELMSPLGFFTLQEGNAYAASGSFLGYLVLAHGFERLVALQRDPLLRFEKAYGADLDQLDADWRAFLAEVPVDLDRQLQARDRFDPDLWPAYSDRCCPKLGSLDPPLREKAELCWKADDWRGALEAYQALWAERHGARLAYQAAQCLRWLDRPADAEALLAEALAQPDLPDDERFRLQQGRQACQMERSDWAGLAASLAEPLPEGRRASRDRQRLARLLAEEPLRPAVAAVLLSQEPTRRRVLLEALVAAHPELEDLRYLYTTRVFEDLAQPWGLGLRSIERERVADALAHAREAPGAVDELAEELLGFLDKAIRAGELDLAERVAAEALALAQEPQPRLRLQLRMERVAWEREHAAELP